MMKHDFWNNEFDGWYAEGWIFLAIDHGSPTHLEGVWLSRSGAPTKNHGGQQLRATNNSFSGWKSINLGWQGLTHTGWMIMAGSREPTTNQLGVTRDVSINCVPGLPIEREHFGATCGYPSIHPNVELRLRTCPCNFECTAGCCWMYLPGHPGL